MKPGQFPEWQRLAVLAVSSLIITLSAFSIYTAATNWTSLPTNPVVVLYFFVMLIAVPLMALRAFMLAAQQRDPRRAMILTAIPAVILILRAVFVGGL